MPGNAPLAVFRADASVAIGGGHVYRCLALADHLAGFGWRCVFAVTAETRRLSPALAESPHATLEVAPCESGPAEAQALDVGESIGARCDLLVVDHYGLDAAFERAARAWSTRVMVIDDVPGRPHDCDLLLDQTHARRPDAYGGIVPPEAIVLAGSDHALLRREFTRLRATSRKRRDYHGGMRSILVSLGSTDPNDVARKAVEGIAASGLDVETRLVVTSSMPRRDELACAARRMLPGVVVHDDVRDVATLMADTDLAVGGGGTMSWERCSLGLPALVVVTAENQRDVARGLDAAGAAVNLGWHEDVTPETIAAALAGLAADRGRLTRMARNGFSICDGLGGLRVALALQAEARANDGKPVALRAAADSDEDRTFDWQTHPDARRFARNPDPPDRRTHAAWFEASLSNPDRILMIIEHGGRAAGVLRLDAVDPARFGIGGAGCGAGRSYEVSILVEPSSQGHGVARAALEVARGLFRGASIWAEVLSGNEASAALFGRAGYRQVRPGLLVNRASGEDCQ